MSKSTNYVDTFITIAGDCQTAKGLVPRGEATVAGLQLSLLRASPYSMTSDDLLFEVHARRLGFADSDREDARADFFAKSQACLRASPAF